MPYKIEPYNIYQLKSISPRRSTLGQAHCSIHAIINEFVSSGLECCRVYRGSDSYTSQNIVTGLNKALSALGRRNTIGVVRRGGDIFLVQKSKWLEINKEGKL